MTIVYTSKTGFTREYAQMLGRPPGCRSVPWTRLRERWGPGATSCTWDG